MKLRKDSKNIYLIPTININYDRYYEWDLIYVSIEFKWLMYFISLPIIKEEI